MENEIIKAATSAIKLRSTSGSVSEFTKNAQSIAKAWIKTCWQLDPNRFSFEETIHPDFNERFDLLDKQEMTAYEFKVSGKNAQNEFYKDVVKVVVWNGLKPQNKINKLVFITEKEGSKHLNKKFIETYIRMLINENIKIRIEYI